MVYDIVGNLGEEFVGEMRPVGCHGIGGCDRTECHGTFIGAFVAHHAHALHGKKDYACLPHFVIEVPVAEPLDEDVVGFLEHMHFFRSDVAEYAHCQAGAGEWVALDEVVGHA